MRRIALLPVLTLPFVIAALPAASLLGGLHSGSNGQSLVVVNGASTSAVLQAADTTGLGPVTDPVAYGVTSPTPVDCHASSTAAIEG